MSSAAPNSVSQRTGSSASIRGSPSGPAHREAVVLRRDLDPAGLEVLDRVVRAAVAERELEGLEADRPAEQLVAEADADHRALADDLAHRVDDVVERGRVAGAVGEEDQVGVAAEDLLGGRRAGKQRHPAVPLAELPNDRELDAGVDPDHVRAVAVDLDRLARASRSRAKSAPVHRRLGLDPLARLGLGDVGREDPAAHRAPVADVADERAGVDAADRRHAAVREPVEPAALGVGGVLAVLAPRA